MGREGAILATRDGGQTWNSVGPKRIPGVDPRPPGTPEIWPSPAAWFFTLLAGLWFALTLIKLSADLAALRHLDQGGVDDNPIARPADDKLGNRALAEALALLLLSRDTKPPLALAVCAPWGRGKSSVLGMLARQLALQGAHPVWFNAWHYRDDTQLLAALIEHMRDQLLPSPFHLKALAFRGQLLWVRVVRPWLPLLAVLVAAASGYFAWEDAAFPGRAQPRIAIGCCGCLLAVCAACGGGEQVGFHPVGKAISGPGLGVSGLGTGLRHCLRRGEAGGAFRSRPREGGDSGDSTRHGRGNRPQPSTQATGSGAGAAAWGR